MQEAGQGQILLYGGFGTGGKPLNDAWLLDWGTSTWQRVYYGLSDLLPPQVAGSRSWPLPISYRSW